MYVIEPHIKQDPWLRWGLPDRVFFACGACHVLAYAFLERFAEHGFRAVWIRPDAGFTGNHIFVARGEVAFDYHGYSARAALLDHIRRKARRWWPGWSYTLQPLPQQVLVSEAASRRYDGLWLREPTQFLHDALPRARAFLDPYPAPGACRTT